MKYTIISHNNLNEIQVEIADFRVSLLDLGATLKSISYKKGNKDINALLEYKDIESYRNNDIFLGSSIGRFTGRIKYNEALFSSDIRNNGNNVLHGGPSSSAAKVWDYLITENERDISVTFSTIHEHDGFNGSLETNITYVISEKEVMIKYDSIPIGESICNITNHAYFTLGQENINDLIVKLKGGEIFLVDENQLPTGETVKMPAKTTIKELDKMFPNTKGIDHPVSLTGPLVISSKDTSIEITTSYDYVVLYGQSYESQHEFASTSFKTKAGLAIELQHLPNKPVLYKTKQEEYIKYTFK